MSNIDAGAYGLKHDGMRELCASVRLRPVWFAAMVLSAAVLQGQDSHVIISPGAATLLVGESKSFRLVDENGRFQHDVLWTVSDPAAFQVQDGDELTITAKQTGDFRITARGARPADASAEATVKVMEGDQLPVGTVRWSAGATPGCKTVKIVPAMPTANGPDLFEQSQCADGQYIAAYTAEGIQMWRRKLGNGDIPVAAGAIPVAGGAKPPVASRLDLSSKSICDLVLVGADQAKIRALLGQRNLSFREGAPSERVWIVEQSGTQCKLWFDAKLLLTKKLKVFVTE
jgi:hypothetical protein